MPNQVAEKSSILAFGIGEIVTMENPYHCRGASTGMVECLTEQGWFQIWWKEDGDEQITPSFRSYEGYELKSIEG